MNGKQKRTLLVLVALAVAVAVVNASVFVYYGLTVNISGTEAEVRFAVGSNAGKSDLASRTITVNLDGSYNTKATITIHPTNEKTYYRDVLGIENHGVNRYYYAWIKVNTPISNQYIISATLYIKTSPKDPPNVAIATIDLKSNTIQPAYPNYITIPKATQTTDQNGNTVTTPGKLYIDIEIQIAGNVDASTVSDTAVLELIYSPQNIETP